MFITKMSLPRRTFLRGMGVTLALPLLESMVPALTATAKTAANPQRRFGAIFVPLGERPGYWTPKTVGQNFEFTPILKPLEPFRDHVTIVSELCDPLDGHATTVAAWLSGVIPKRTIAEDVHNGVTIDQVIAKQIGQDTVYPSIELATEDFTGYVGGCDTQYACAYMNTLSWANEKTPLPMEINPRVTFERMFGRAGTSQQRLARMQTDKSILDSVRDDVKDLQGGLGSKDKSRLSDYLENVREIEARIQKAEKQATTTVADESVHLHDEPRREPARVSEYRHRRAAPLDVASRQQPGEAGEPREAERVPHVALREVRQEAAEHAGRRRLVARSLADHVWQRHERKRHALTAQRARGDRRPRGRPGEGQPACPDTEGNAAREPDARLRPEVRLRHREVRDAQHRTGR